MSVGNFVESAPRWGDAAQALFRTAQAVSHPGGPGLFDDIVRELADLLGSATVFIAVFSDDGPTQLRTLAAVLDGKRLAGFDYPLEGSPWAGDVGESFRYVASGVAAEFRPGTLFSAQGMDSYAAYPLNDGAGAPLGLLVAMDRVPVADAALAEALLKVFAGRIVAEIERGRFEQALRTAALAVSSAHGDMVFAELARYLAAVLHVDLAFIASHEPDQTPDMHMLAVACDGRVDSGARYALATSPCAAVLDRGFRAWPDRLREFFPGDSDAAALGLESYAGFPIADSRGRPLGTLGVASRRPLVQLERVESMLQIFAVRAGAELERLRATEALRRSEASYRAIFEAAEDAIFVHDWDTFAVLDVNPKACQTYGCSREELMRLSVAEVSSGVPPYTAEQALHHLQLAKLGRCPPFEWHRRNKDGSLRWDEVRLKPAQVDGRPHILAFTRDITERKAADAMLRASEEQYRAIFSASADALILWDKEFRRVDVNPAYERMFGWTREEVLGHSWDRPGDGDEYAGPRRELVCRALAGETCRAELASRRKDGAIIQIEVHATPFRHQGEPHVLAIARDITSRHTAEAERAALEAQLRQAQKMEAIGQLTGGVAHDFNNILTSVLGYLVLGDERARKLGDATLVRQLGQAQLAAQRARELIAQMLAFARRQRGERRPVALDRLVRQSLQLLRPSLPASVVLDTTDLDAIADAALPPVHADAVQLEQVLFNLCINARDAMEGAGSIRVGLRETSGGGWRCTSCGHAIPAGRWVELCVADSGSGIAPETLQRMFEPFYTTKEVGRGSGMGLAMVHGIVHEHGGHVVVDSAPGTGTDFRVLVPAADGPGVEPHSPLDVASVEAPRLRGSVLLVEDETMVGDFMVELLGGWGLDVALLRDPLAAREWLDDETNHVDLLITDQTMPQMTGLELARRCRDIRPALPVLLYSGNAETIDAQALERHGVRALLRKPVDADALRGALRACLGEAQVAKR